MIPNELINEEELERLLDLLAINRIKELAVSIYQSGAGKSLCGGNVTIKEMTSAEIIDAKKTRFP